MNEIVEQKPKLLSRMAERFGVDADKMLVTLKATAFKGDVSNEQMIALLIVAEQYGLNPWTREIYAFPDRNGIVPVIGVDGWCRIINEHPMCNGFEFIEDAEGKWIDCKMYRKDREYPTIAREWLAECKRDTQPWKSHPRRMLRHKSLIQCARMVFGFVGVYDQDEAERIVEATNTHEKLGDISNIPTELINKHVGNIADLLSQDKDEYAIADDLREYVAVEFKGIGEVYGLVSDKLKTEGIITKTKWREYIALQPPIGGAA